MSVSFHPVATGTWVVPISQKGYALLLYPQLLVISPLSVGSIDDEEFDHTACFFRSGQSMPVMGDTPGSVFGLCFTLLMGVLIILLPRRSAALPLVMTACYITLGQVVSIATLGFTMVRIVCCFGLVRIVARGELFRIRVHRIDKLYVLYVLWAMCAYILLRKSTDAVINQLGFGYDAIGIYFIFRSLVHNRADVHAIFRMMALVIVPLALLMTVEKLTGRNHFSVFGGVPEQTVMREGRLRAQGAFMHPILAGTFGATSMPYFVALWFEGGRWRMLAWLGIASAAIISLTPASSGPMIACLAVLVGMAMWPFRAHMRTVRWLLAATLLLLHVAMKAPVWAVIGKVSGVIGGTGWHRVALIDAAIEHFNEWWLLGTDYTRHWLPTGVTWSEQHTDITNHFISVGIRGGLLALVFFSVIIVTCFKAVGDKVTSKMTAGGVAGLTPWCLGVAMFAHVVSFLSVYYFDQIVIFWYLLLALITSSAGHDALDSQEYPG